MKKIIFRADDLGYSQGVNLGIQKCVEQHKLDVVGLIVNLEQSQDGYDRIKDYQISIGLHVNITSGKPISNHVPSLVDQNGNFIQSKVYRNQSISIDFDDIYKEVRAQISQFKSITGKLPDYIEGHAILHETYLHAIETVAKEYSILFVPSLISSDEYFTINNHKVHMWLESSNPCYNPKELYEKVIHQQREDVEIIIFHPGFIDDVIYKTSSMLLPRIQEVVFLETVNEDASTQRVSYKDLERG